jgi:hypothetical protein
MTAHNVLRDIDFFVACVNKTIFGAPTRHFFVSFLHMLGKIFTKKNLCASILPVISFIILQYFEKLYSLHFLI